MKYLMFVLALMFCYSASADRFRGFDDNGMLPAIGLLEICSPESVATATHENGICLGYIDAVVWLSHSKYCGYGRNSFCPPIGNTKIQEMLIIRKYIAAHPEAMHKAAFILVIDALTEAWPCKEKEN